MERSRNHRVFRDGETIGRRFKGGGGGGGGTSTTTTSIPGWYEPYATYGLEQAKNLYDTKPQSYYPGQTVAGFTPEQTVAQNMTTQRALQGSPLLGAADRQQYNTIQGGYLSPDSNPYLKSYADAAIQPITQNYLNNVVPQGNTTANASGRYGSDTWALMQGQNANNYLNQVGNTAASIYAPAYQQERGLQQASSLAAPALAQADYTDIGKLAAVGEEKQGMQQSLIDEAINKYNFNQMEPWQRLGMYANLISGDYGGNSTTTSQQSGGGGK